MPAASTPPLRDLEPRRICLVKPSALGDVVQSLPVLAGLRNRWPTAHIAWVVNRSLAGLLKGHPQLDEVVEFDRGGRGLRRVAAMARMVARLRREPFDLTLDLQGLFRSGLLTWLSRASRRVGLAGAREGAARFYTDVVPLAAAETSAVDRYWRVAAALGCPGGPPRPLLGIGAEHRAWVRAQLGGLPRPWLIVHPGAQWETKRWPPERFSVVARQAQEQYGAGVVLVGGPGEAPLAQRVAANLNERACVDLAQRTSLLQLAALAEQADVFLSGDTGPMHLAAAVGARVVAVFTCTSPVRAGPYGPGHRVVATQVDCAASYLRTCGKLTCMTELTPERVWPAVAAALDEAIVSVRAG